MINYWCLCLLPTIAQFCFLTWPSFPILYIFICWPQLLKSSEHFASNSFILAPSTQRSTFKWFFIIINSRRLEISPAICVTTLKLFIHFNCVHQFTRRVILLLRKMMCAHHENGRVSDKEISWIVGNSFVCKYATHCAYFSGELVNDFIKYKIIGKHQNAWILNCFANSI